MGWRDVAKIRTIEDFLQRHHGVRLFYEYRSSVPEFEKKRCWVWYGGTIKGHGSVWFRGRNWFTHRVTYTLVYGEPPEGFHVHHKCEVKICCNPKHLEALPPKEHYRGHKLKRYCVKGHDTWIDGGRRPDHGCYQCHRDEARERRKRNK